MVNRTLQPQEIEVFYILPALRRELAVCMKGKGVAQKDIARLLGVTPAAISQYIGAKRAGEVLFNDQFKSAVKSSALAVVDELSAVREMQKLLKLARDERIVCRFHESIGSVPKGCGLCFDHC